MDEASELRQQELARLMLQKAQQDLALVQAVLESSDVADEIIGFHAQQTIEQSIKAVLTRQGVEYRFTHDLAVLYSQAEAVGIAPPGSLDDVDPFTDFAAQFRYVVFQAQDLDREASAELAARFAEWADNSIEKVSQPSDASIGQAR